MRSPALATRSLARHARGGRDRLADDLADPPTLAELAKLSGLSRYQVLRRFERSHGLPPHAWLVQRRAERARGLIRVFVRQFGFTPGAWRKAHLQ